jgi:SSS family solute:Na+ symporter
MPFVIVLPGICAAVLFPLLEKSDQAYPSMMTLLPNGLLGLTFAALIAAIVSSLASMTNSVSTIFTMDVYKTFAKNNPSQSTLLKIGRSSALLSVVIAAFVAKPLLGSFERIFQYIQEFTGLFTPGILVIFLVALFWKKATALSVLTAAITSVVLSVAIKIGLPDLAYIHRMGIVFFMSGLSCYLTAMFQGMKVQEKAINLSDIDFSTTKAFNLNWLVITIILIITYIILG